MSLLIFKSCVNVGCYRKCAEQLQALAEERNRHGDGGSRFRTALGRSLDGQNVPFSKAALRNDRIMRERIGEDDGQNCATSARCTSRPQRQSTVRYE